MKIYTFFKMNEQNRREWSEIKASIRTIRLQISKIKANIVSLTEGINRIHQQSTTTNELDIELTKLQKGVAEAILDVEILNGKKHDLMDIQLQIIGMKIAHGREKTYN